MHPLLKFNDPALLQQALTHSSYANENPEVIVDNERLEFLGDAILNFLCGEYLYHQNPTMAEGEMTRRRAALVDEQQLAQFACVMGLARKIRLGQGVGRYQGVPNANLLSSAFEAVVGAYYLDRGCDINAVRELVIQFFDSVPETVLKERSALDPRNQFQTWVQKNLDARADRTYVTEKVGGQDHAPEFLAKLYVLGKLYGEGRGRSKKEAEREAAKDALDGLKADGQL